MAKFAMVFCFLLIVCKVDFATQEDESAKGRSIFSMISNLIMEQWQFFVTEALSHKTELEARNKEATNNAKQYNNVVEYTLQSAIAQWKQELKMFTESAADVSSCTASTIDMEKIAGQIQSDVGSCIQRNAKRLAEEYDSIKNAFDRFTKSIGEVRKAAQLCSGGIWAAVTCVTKIWHKVSSETTVEWNVLWAEASNLNKAFNDFQTALTTCGFPAAVQSLMDKAEDARIRIRECITEIESPKYS